MASSAARKRVEKPRTPRPIRRHLKPVEEKPQGRSFVREVAVIALSALGVFLFCALVSEFNSVDSIAGNIMGPVGQWTAHDLRRYLGWCSFVSVLWAFLLAHTVWSSSSTTRPKGFNGVFLVLCGSLLMATFGAGLATVVFGVRGGGLIGARLSDGLVPYLNTSGAALVTLCGFVVSLVIATGVTVTDIVQVTARGVNVSGNFGKFLGRIQFRVTVFFARLGYRGTAKFFGKLIGKFRGPEGDEERDEPLLVPEVIDRDEAELDEEDEVEITPPTRIEWDPPTKATKLLTKHEPDLFDEDDEDDLDEDEEEELKAAQRAEAAARKGFAAGLKKRLEERRKEREERHKNKGPAKRIAAKSSASGKRFSLPPLDLLAKPDDHSQHLPKKEELLRNCKQLETTLLDFRVGGTIVDAQPGPVITLYQFDPAPGIKVQKIINLADDIARALKVESVRVYAPVPGKGTVGIEVPNAMREIVRLRDLLDGEKFLDTESALALALGKDVAGDPFVADLTKMPHLLIAGATGTGKSVCINSLLMSLVYRNTPAEMRLILIDPKMLELSVYEGIPHLKAPVVTIPHRARGVLWWAVEEMERRYKLMMELKVRNIDSYNKVITQQLGEDAPSVKGKVIELEEQDILAVSDPDIGIERADRHEAESVSATPAKAEPLPRIVIVVDELADLMLTVGREVEELVTRLAQKARASGIHLILATQRPSVDVITGLIKANFPARISFKVVSRIDARTVLDNSGAEKLLGQGDMLFMTAGAGRLKRIHSAFVSDAEVTEVCDWLRLQGEPDYDPRIEEMIQRLDEMEKGVGAGGVQQDFEFDPLYDQAVNLVIEKGAASTSMVQRAFRIGYNRAASIVESMEREGVVGPADGAKPRQVLLGDRNLI